MQQIATLKAGQVAARYGEHAPMATACCNACRSCVQTNLLGLVLTAGAAVVVPLRRLVRR